MRYSVPHPIPYQGSKRRLAPAILSFVPKGRFRRMVEPFAGSAAITLAAAKSGLCDEFVISDALRPLANLWTEVIEHPEQLSVAYRELWQSQFEGNAIDRYNDIRAEFNRKQNPAMLLFLLARCVKNAVRFNPSGQFNQSADKRRTGTHPDTMHVELTGAHHLLRGRCKVMCRDFRALLAEAQKDDVVYLDPPYQGTTEGRDSRYFQGVPREAIIRLLEVLNERGVQYILSYDGHCGSKTYGKPLPANLNAQRVLLNVGRSSQATLNGESFETVESIYLSAGLSLEELPSEPMLLEHFDAQIPLRP
ncbi:MAG: DNA adenine methylase [Candidatus Korobacteraceae bacterium]